jgi:GNAT superfamily N-acetyltransferase
MKNVYARIIKEGKIDRLAIADVMEINQNEYLITRLFVPEKQRGKGIGTDILGEIVNDADKECSTLLIEPRPYGEITEKKFDRLVKFYEKFDFKFFNEEIPMKRNPKCEKK